MPAPLGTLLLDWAGRRFGRLVVVRDGGVIRRWNGRANGRRWHCQCDCGRAHVALSSNLRAGRTVSCGCVQAANRLVATRTHGETAGDGVRRRPSAEYRTWQGIKRRCENTHEQAYQQYGARGIRMCQEWSASFEAFLRYVGRKPSAAHSIDRLDNDAGYEPGNVRWATPREQVRNRRISKLTEDDVRAIRLRVAAGEHYRTIAADYGVDKTMIGHIAHRRSWADVV